MPKDQVVQLKQESTLEDIDFSEVDENTCFCCMEPKDTAHVGHVKCNFCPKSFKSHLNLERHLFTIHSASTEFPCECCNATCPSKLVLELHMESHSTGKPFSCQVSRFHSCCHSIAVWFRLTFYIHSNRDRCAAGTLRVNIIWIDIKCTASVAAARTSLSLRVKCVREFSQGSTIWGNIYAVTWESRPAAKTISVRTATNRFTDRHCWTFTFGRIPGRNRFCKWSRIVVRKWWEIFNAQFSVAISVRSHFLPTGRYVNIVECIRGKENTIAAETFNRAAVVKLLCCVQALN